MKSNATAVRTYVLLKFATGAGFYSILSLRERHKVSRLQMVPIAVGKCDILGGVQQITSVAARTATPERGSEQDRTHSNFSFKDLSKQFYLYDEKVKI